MSAGKNIYTNTLEFEPKLDGGFTWYTGSTPKVRLSSGDFVYLYELAEYNDRLAEILDKLSYVIEVDVAFFAEDDEDEEEEL